MGAATSRGPAASREHVLSSRNAAGFNEWLRSQLKVRRISQRQLAVRSGVDHSSISRLVRGDRMPSLGTAMKLARSMDPADRDIRGQWPGRSNSPNAAAGVEYALRADDQLCDADIRDVMLYYLSARRRRSNGSARRG
jgi:transcriptional regulator with XRE-family HTH domain